MHLNLAALNSATKYPSILTYHALGERGALTEDRSHDWGDLDPDFPVIVTEKVDGTNSRVITFPNGDWFIGSREELLTSKNDRIHNPAQGIVDAIRPVAESLKASDDGDWITVFYLETYGHKIGGQAKQYTGTGNVGHRLFDVAFIPPEVLTWGHEDIASWRDKGGQHFATEPTLHRAAEHNGLELTPRLGTVRVKGLPTTVEDMATWLDAVLPSTLVALDDRALGRPESVVLRTPDRGIIAKARNEDYTRTLKRRTQR
jgi:hypothetical protein